MARTLVEWLRTRTPEQLTALLTSRPETTLRPVPRDLAELADRLSVPSAVAAALHRLPWPAVQVVEVLQLLGEDGGERGELGRWLGCRPDDPDLARVLARLGEVGLVWPADGAGDRLQMAAPLYRAFRFPLGLGAPAATLLSRYPLEHLRPVARALGVRTSGRRAQLVAAITAVLTDPEQVRALLADAPEPVRAQLTTLARNGPDPQEHAGWHAAHRPDPTFSWAAARGLMLTDSWGLPQVPREVATALRGPGWHAPFQPHRPEPPVNGVTAAAVTRESAAAASAALEALETVLTAVDATPPALRKSGGVGVKELRRIARVTGLRERDVRMWLEVAYEAELVGVVPDRAGGGELLPTPDYDRWAAAEPADRLAAVLPAWTVLPASPLADPAGGAGKPAPALLRDHSGQYARAVREVVLDLIGALPPEVGVADPEQLLRTVEWQSPLLLADVPAAEELVRSAWQEAERLGVVAHGAATPLAAALAETVTAAPDRSGLRAPDGLVAACRRLLPAASDEAVFQADLTVLVPGFPEPALSRLLDDAADRESRGGAVTWRFTPGSVRRALDAGHQPDALLDRLRGHAAGGALPQPLTYLVTDVARRHGAVRVRPAASVLHTGDEALAAELAGARTLRRLGLSPLGPGVLAAQAPVPAVLEALRAAGYAPVAESRDGGPELGPPERRRAGVRRPGPRPSRRGDGGDDQPAGSPAALAERLLAAPVPRQAPRPRGAPGRPADDSAEWYGGALEWYDVDDGWDPTSPALPVLSVAVAEAAGHLPTGEQELLARALTTGAPVQITYTDTQGERTHRVIEAAELDGGHVVAWCLLRDDERRFALRRIEAVAPAP